MWLVFTLLYFVLVYTMTATLRNLGLDVNMFTSGQEWTLYGGLLLSNILGFVEGKLSK